MGHKFFKCNRVYRLASAIVVIVAALFLACPAQAQIIYTPVDIFIYDNGTYNLDLNNDGITDFTITASSSKTCNCNPRGCQFYHSIAETPTSGDGVVGSPPWRLTFGHEIGPKQVFFGGKGYLIYQWHSCSGGGGEGKWGWNEKNHYLGLSFQINSETHYGWAEISLCGVSCAELTGYAYEATPGKALTAGQTQ